VNFFGNIKTLLEREEKRTRTRTTRVQFQETAPLTDLEFPRILSISAVLER
jgi:hypothetical protein